MHKTSVVKYVKLATEGTTVSSYEYKTKGGSNGRNLVSSAPHYEQYLSAHAGNKTGKLNVKMDCTLLYRIYVFLIKFLILKLLSPLC
jgi:endoglucanase Acf2